MANVGNMPAVPGYPAIITSINDNGRPRRVGPRLRDNPHPMMTMEYLMAQEQIMAEFLADVRKDLSKPSEEADRASNSTTTNSGDLLGRPSASAITTDERNAQPAIKSFKPPVSEFTFHFPKPNSISAQNLTNERPMDIIFRIVTPPGASSQAPDRARAKSATKKTQDPPELTLWALLQRDGYTLFPPPTGSVLETAISLAFPRPASETARRGWPALERLLYRPSTKDGISRFFPI